MHIVFELLMAASLIGGVDVIYFHLYKFRLYERPDSVIEETTHLIRAVLFITGALMIALSDGSAWVRTAVLALFALDLLNSAIDVLVEKNSRESLGGLPSVEYLLHVLATFAMGAAVALFWTHSSASGFTPPALSAVDYVRMYGGVAVGVVLLGIEATLFARAIAARRRTAQRRLVAA